MEILRIKQSEVHRRGQSRSYKFGKWMIDKAIRLGEIFFRDKVFLEESTPQYWDSSTMKGQEKEDDTEVWPAGCEENQKSLCPEC